MDLNRIFKDLNCILNKMLWKKIVEISYLVESCSLNYRKTSSYMSFLVSNNFVNKMGRGKYSLTEKGYRLLDLLNEIYYSLDENMLLDENFEFKPLNFRELSKILSLSKDLKPSLLHIIRESTSSRNIIPIHHIIIRLLQICEDEHVDKTLYNSLLLNLSKLINEYGYKYFTLIDTVLDVSSNNLINALYNNIIGFAPFSSPILFPYINKAVTNELKRIEFVVDHLTEKLNDIGYQYIVYNVKSTLELEKLLSSSYKGFKSLVIHSSLINEAFIREYTKSILEYLRNHTKSIILCSLNKSNISSNGILVKKEIIIPINLSLARKFRYSVSYISQILEEVSRVSNLMLDDLGLDRNHRFLVRLSGDQEYDYIRDLVSSLSRSYLIGVDENASRRLFNYLSSIKELSAYRVIRIPIYSHENLVNTLKSYIMKNMDEPVLLEYKGV